MILTAEQIEKEALSLPDDARALLADRLLESLDPAEEGRLHDIWSVEANRRLAEIRSGSVASIPAEEALAGVRRALGR